MGSRDLMAFSSSVGRDQRSTQRCVCKGTAWGRTGSRAMGSGLAVSIWRRGSSLDLLDDPADLGQL